MAEGVKRTVTEAMVAELAELAELELDAERRALVAETLDGLLVEASRVNRFMAARREIGPAVRFDHPGFGEDEL